MDYKQIPLNAQISPDDDRDYLVSKLIAQVSVFPTEFLIPYNHEVKNQGMVSSCVAHSLAYCKEIIEEKQSNKFKQFSVGYIYGNRSTTDYQKPGMYPREALSHLLDGNVLYEDFPYNLEMPEIMGKVYAQSSTLVLKAYPYRITAYCRLYSIDDIKNALMQIGAVTVSYPIYNSFYNTGSNGIVPIPSGSIHGNHMMTIIGWIVIDNVEYWVILNSWGSNWGKNGQCFIKTSVGFNEAWSVTDTIIPHPEPEPIKQTYWRVQVGAFSEEWRADNFKKELENKGLKTYKIKINNLFKIQLNAFIEKPRAELFKQKIIDMGYKAFLVNY